MATRVGHLAGRTVIAADGKSLRGSTPAGGVMPHLLGALHHGSGVVAGQRAVATKSNEIPALPLLLADFDLDGVVVTADALHCQRATATFITDRGGHYLLTVKGNQPTLRSQLKTLLWTHVPAVTTISTTHGQRVQPTIKTVTAPTWLDFPAAAQVLQVRRTRTVNGRTHIEVVYAICSLDMIAAPPVTVATWLRGHWSIGNARHWVRDVVFQDRHQLRTGSGPRVMATLPDTAISLLRLAGHSQIAAVRHHARDSRRAGDLLATSGTDFAEALGGLGSGTSARPSHPERTDDNVAFRPLTYLLFSLLQAHDRAVPDREGAPHEAQVPIDSSPVA